ncbi:MAG: recombinase family protein [Patescibacteria group bacterium]|jgi:site-specific DNA recombinase
MTTKLNYYAYLRVSTENQKRDETINIQEVAINEYAEKNNINIVRMFNDNGVSGGLENRPALAELLDALEINGKDIEGIIIFKLDRLARDVRIQENLIYDLQEKRGKKIISIKEPDLGSKDITRVLMRQMLGAISQYEKGLITMRLKAGRLHKLRKGGFPGGGVAMGYEVVDNELIINQKDVKIVRQIYYLKRYKRLNLTAIAKNLNGNNIKTPKGGKRWYAATVKYILNNSIYRGRMTYCGVEAIRADLSLVLGKK